MAPDYANIERITTRRDGAASIRLIDGRTIHFPDATNPFPEGTALDKTELLPNVPEACLTTLRGDDIVIELPRPHDFAPLGGRKTVYLDQNHWSTLTHALHDPDRIRDPTELAAALALIEQARSRTVVLPLSAGHLMETAKQQNAEERYRRALTQAQLSAGWQLADPLAVRRFELRTILAARYTHERRPFPPAVTLEANAIRAERQFPPLRFAGTPADVRPMLQATVAACANFDVVLGPEATPTTPPAGWVADLQRFGDFLDQNPSGPERKHARTQAKFIADLGRELPEEASHARISPAQLSDWLQNHCTQDVAAMPMLGLYREVMHEKLARNRLVWKSNDLTDMIYLTCAAGYCNFIVGERTHISHITQAARRLNRPLQAFRRLANLVPALAG